MKTGDLFWMIEDNSPRGHYPLARIKSLNYGNNGIAGSAVIRSLAGEYARQILNLAPVIAPLGRRILALLTVRSFYNVVM